MVTYIEHFDKIGTPTISEDYILTLDNNSNYIGTPSTQLLDFSKPFKFKINFSTLSGSGNLTWSMNGSFASISGLNFYWSGSQGRMICAVGNGSSFTDISMTYTANQQNNFILEWDGSVYTAYVEYKDGSISSKFTMNSTEPIPNCMMAIGRYGRFTSDLKEFSLEHTDGSYKFELVSTIVIPETITEKLTYLSETKDLIKQAIIDKGVEVATSLPFRKYADKIAEISGGGGGSTSGDLYNTKTVYLNTIPTEYQGIKGIKIKGNKSNGDRVTYIGGIKPYHFYDDDNPQDLNVREIFNYKSDSTVYQFKFKDLIYRQRFVIEDQHDTPHTALGVDEYNSFMVCARDEKDSNPYSSYASYRVYFNKPYVSGYYGTFWVIYTCDIWKNADPVNVNIGDIVDIIYEFENDSTLKITTQVNDNEPVIHYTSSSDASSITNLGNSDINSNTFGGHTYYLPSNSDKFGINTILLEGTSIYSKLHDKYIWQLIKD